MYTTRDAGEYFPRVGTDSPAHWTVYRTDAEDTVADLYYPDQFSEIRKYCHVQKCVKFEVTTGVGLLLKVSVVIIE